MVAGKRGGGALTVGVCGEGECPFGVLSGGAGLAIFVRLGPLGPALQRWTAWSPPPRGRATCRLGVCAPRHPRPELLLPVAVVLRPVRADFWIHVCYCCWGGPRRRGVFGCCTALYRAGHAQQCPAMPSNAQSASAESRAERAEHALAPGEGPMSGAEPNQRRTRLRALLAGVFDGTGRGGDGAGRRIARAAPAFGLSPTAAPPPPH